MSRASLHSLSLLLFTCLACAESDHEHPTVSEWQGLEPHAELHGEVEGERVDVSVVGEGVACKREYEVGDPDDPSSWAGDGRFKEFEVAIDLVVDGVERRYELEFYGHDFPSSEVGRVLTIVGVDEADPDAPLAADEVHVEVQWEWEAGDEFVAFEAVAIAGSLELREMSGMVGADGLVIPADEGSFGGFATIELPEGELAVSFTAPCVEVEVETP
ncbi:hypothetical protein ACNOYE_32175 [Nannocystaceae bacterium ST9]